MSISEDPTVPDASGHSLWLEVRWNDYARLFRFRRDEDRAVVVGSLARAEVRVDGPDIAPVHFHFERENDHLCLIPAYHSELRLNAARVAGPCAIEERAAIEFSGMRVNATIHHRRPAVSESLPPPPSNDAVPNGRAYLTALPDENMSTAKVRSPATAPSRRVAFDLPTAKVARSALEQAVPVQTTEKLPKAGLVTPEPTWEKTSPLPPFRGAVQALGPTGTEMMRAPRLDHARNHRAADVRVAVPLISKPLDPQRTLTWGMNVQSPFNGDRESSPASTPSDGAGSGDRTEFDLPAFVKPEPDPPATEHVETTSNEPRPDKGPAAPLLRRAARWARNVAVSGMSAVTRLGTLAKKRPAPVAAGALTGALVLALALVGVTTIISKSPPEGSRQMLNVKASASLASAMPSAKAHSKKPTPSASPVPSPVVAPSLMASPSSSAEPSKRSIGTSDPEVVQAVGHLISGRHSEAERAYAKLALRTPESPAFAVLAELIKKRSEPACARGTASSKACPEMKP